MARIFSYQYFDPLVFDAFVPNFVDLNAGLAVAPSFSASLHVVHTVYLTAIEIVQPAFTSDGLELLAGLKATITVDTDFLVEFDDTMFWTPRTIPQGGWTTVYGE